MGPKGKLPIILLKEHNHKMTQWHVAMPIDQSIAQVSAEKEVAINAETYKLDNVQRVIQIVRVRDSG